MCGFRYIPRSRSESGHGYCSNRICSRSWEQKERRHAWEAEHYKEQHDDQGVQDYDILAHHGGSQGLQWPGEGSKGIGKGEEAFKGSIVGSARFILFEVNKVGESRPAITTKRDGNEQPMIGWQ